MTHQVFVCHGVHLLGTAHLTVQNEGICCCSVQEVQQDDPLLGSSVSVGGVVQNELI